MPVAPMRACPGRCGGVTAPGQRRCEKCEAELQARRTANPEPSRPRESSSARGYGWAWHRYFRAMFLQALADAGIEPTCGAALPDGPQTAHSVCKAQGLRVWASADGTNLHMNHHPELTDDERLDNLKVQDPLRIELLCASCHGRLASGGSARHPGGVHKSGHEGRPTALGAQKFAFATSFATGER